MPFAMAAGGISSDKGVGGAITSSVTGGTVTTTDTVVSGETIRTLVPENRLGALAIYHHGSSESHASVSGSLMQGIVDGLTSRGWIVASTNASGNNWGNQAGIDAYSSLYTHVSGLYTITKTVHIAGSMGGLTALSTLTAGVVPFDGLLAIYPVCSLLDLWTNGGGFIQGLIRTAHGIAADGSDYASKTAGKDPMLQATAGFLDVPMRFYASAADTVVSKTTNTDAFRTKIAATTAERELVVCSGDHGDTSHFQPDDAIPFMERCIS